jgi:hypothetical protein
VDSLASSLGALAMVVTAPGRLVLPSPAGEAFWIGLVPEAGGRSADVALAAVLDSGDMVDLLTGAPPAGAGQRVRVPPWRGIPGVPRGDGTWWALAHERGVRALVLSSGPEPAARLDVVGVAEFEALSGSRVPPLDDSHRYGGWRLP